MASGRVPNPRTTFLAKPIDRLPVRAYKQLANLKQSKQLADVSRNRDTGFTWLDWCALSAVLLIGLVHLPYPFHTDQALTVLTGERVAGGEVLYRDLWDVRQPGLFFFYTIAGVVFGFSEVGVHLFELLYMLALGVALTITLRSRFETRAIASLVPLFTVGVYYMSVAKTAQLTQLEALVGFPLFFCLWLAANPRGRGGIGWRLFASGVLGGLVGLFKLMLMALPAAFWLAYLLTAARASAPGKARSVVGGALAIALGASIPLAGFALYAWAQDMLGVVYWTFFVYPPQVMEVVWGVLNTPAKLLRSTFWFGLMFGPLLLLAGIRLWGILKGRHRDSVDVGLSLWLVAGALVTIAQIWWSFHWYIFFVPVGVLAAEGLDDWWTRRGQLSSQTNRVAVAALIFMSMPLVSSQGFKTWALVHGQASRQGISLDAYRRTVSPESHEIALSASFLYLPESRPGDIYVVGDARHLYFSGRAQAIAINGVSPAAWTSEVWNRVTRSLVEAKPVYVFVEEWHRDLVAERDLGDLLDNDYEVLKSDAYGTWYVLID